MSSLIYGKNDLTNIVSIEVENNEATIIQEDANGIHQTKVPNLYWLLSDKPLDRGPWSRLKGDLHYKYGRQYPSREKFVKDRGRFRQYDIFSIYDAKEALMVKDGYTYFKGMKPSDVSVLSFDIEATSLVPTKNDKVLLIANTFRRNGVVTRKQFAYDEYKSQPDMLQAWVRYVCEMNPSIMLGHNIFGYDLWYLNEIARFNSIRLNLGRNGSALRFDDFESKFRKEASQYYHYHKAHVWGRELVDTMFVAIRYDQAARKYESYGLKSIIRAEGLEKANRVHYDASQIRNNYKIPAEWERIRTYNIHDGDDPLALYDKMTPPYFYWTQTVPKPYQLVLESATGSQLNSILIRSYLQKGHSLPAANEAIKYQGALSGGLPGIYRNCVKWDVASLYPSIIIQYRVYDKEKDPDGNFLKMVELFRSERLRNKQKAKETHNTYYHDMEQSQKVGINSAYGMLGAAGLLFNSPQKAAFITEKGREILSRAIEFATGKSYERHLLDSQQV